MLEYRQSRLRYAYAPKPNSVVSRINESRTTIYVLAAAPIVLDITAIVLDLESIVRAYASPHPSILDLGAVLDAIVFTGDSHIRAGTIGMSATVPRGPEYAAEDARTLLYCSLELIY